MATAAGQHQQLPLSPPSATGKSAATTTNAGAANTMVLCQAEKETQAMEAAAREVQGKAAAGGDGSDGYGEAVQL